MQGADVDAGSADDLEAQPVDTVSLVEQAQETERRAIARELHDTVIQPLTSLVMSLTSLERQPVSAGLLESYLGAWKELAREALGSLRSTLAGLRTYPHAQFSLPEALGRYIAPEIRSRGIRLSIESHDWPDDLPLDVSSHLYLIVREALTNVQKHAHASEVILLLQGIDEQVSVIIADNGVGFSWRDPAALQRARAGHGLGIGGMQDRARIVGGQLDIVSERGRGVRIELCVPRPVRPPQVQQAHVGLSTYREV